MRRNDREVTDIGEILEIIERCPVVRLGLYGDGEPYIVPLNFGYTYKEDKLALYFHSALEGRKVDLIRSNPRVCFELDNLLGIKNGGEACKWSTGYESIIGYGDITFITDPNGKKSAMDIIMKRYGFESTPEYNSDAFSRTLLYKLDAESFTAKRNPG